MNQQSQSRLDSEPLLGRVKELISAKKSNAYIARNIKDTFGYDTTRDSIRRFRKRHGFDPPSKLEAPAGVTYTGDEVEITTPVTGSVEKDNPEKILVERGYDPEKWSIESVTVNEWEGPVGEGEKTTYRQSKIGLRKRELELAILPARSEGWRPTTRNKPLAPTETELVVVVGDQQAPFHDERLHSLFCEWLADNEPAKAISLGDKVDFPDISRHRLDPENTATVNECIQSGYDVFRDYVTASPDTSWEVIPGNHDERIRNILLDKPSVQPLYGVRQAEGDDGKSPAVLTLPFLLRFDELGIKYIDPKGAYDLAQINLNKNLAVRHGWIARKGSGASALSTLEHLGFSVIVGHTHRQSIVYKTTHDINRETTTLTAAEAGCMCRIDQKPIDGRRWPSYTAAPDWQQGFSTVTIHPNGFFRIENATYVNGALLWRDQCYS